MSDYIVEMKNITKTFPGVIANDDITIQVKKGEIYAILGENGAGKSTLMSVLFGMYEPDEGQVFIRGEEVKLKSPSEAIDLNIGMVHQHFKLVENYTVAENIILGIEPVKRFGIFPYIDMAKSNEEIRNLSQRYGLDVDPNAIIRDINVSMQQRVEILKMLYREAEILIFDEPTAVLTPQEIDYFLKILEELRNDGKTIILITHKLQEIKRVADRCAILNQGKLIDILDVETTSTREMANLMVGREVDFEFDYKLAKKGEKVLEVKNIEVKNSEGFKFVDNVSFDIHSGEIFAIAGVAGNGQVEIADAIAGLTEISKGEILLNGIDISDFNIRARTEKGISYIPEDRQRYGLILDFTLEDNIALKRYYKEPFCISGQLNRFNIRDYANRLIGQYDIRSGQGPITRTRYMSGGNQQKAILAREIELNSPLMIFVQPTRGLDIGAIESVHKMMIEERDKGKAILLVSLELEEIMNVADTIGVIYNGKMEKIAAQEDLTTEEVGGFMMGVGGDE